MSDKYTVSLNSIIEEFQLEKLYMPEKKIYIESSDISRPGLPISGYYGYFDPLRIQILGKTEYGYLEVRREIQHQVEGVRRIDRILIVVCVVVGLGVLCDDRRACLLDHLLVPIGGRLEGYRADEVIV